jgi:hypothetical protein
LPIENWVTAHERGVDNLQSASTIRISARAIFLALMVPACA